MQNSEIVIMFIGVFLAIIIFVISFYLGARFSIKFISEKFMGASFEGRFDDFVSCNKYIEKGNIVFVGDSITQQYNTYEYFDKYKTYNRGIGGDDTIGLLSRMNESIFDLKPNRIFLLIGTNDCASSGLSALETAENITTIINQIEEKSSKSKVHLLSLLPVNKSIDPYSVFPRTNKNITTINEKLKESYPKYFINVNKIFLDNDNELSKKYTRDGLHLNELGYEKLTEELLKYL